MAAQRRVAVEAEGYGEAGDGRLADPGQFGQFDAGEEGCVGGPAHHAVGDPPLGGGQPVALEELLEAGGRTGVRTGDTGLPAGDLPAGGPQAGGLDAGDLDAGGVPPGGAPAPVPRPVACHVAGHAAGHAADAAAVVPVPAHRLFFPARSGACPVLCRPTVRNSWPAPVRATRRDPAVSAPRPRARHCPPEAPLRYSSASPSSSRAATATSSVSGRSSIRGSRASAAKA